MPLFKWKETMSVGVKALDDDHKKIMKMANKVYNIVKNKKDVDQLDQIFPKLFAYVKKHYEREEALLSQTNYPDYQNHLCEHNEKRKELDAIFSSFLSDRDKTLNLDLMIFLCNWWTNHIMTTDKKYKEHLNGKGIF